MRNIKIVLEYDGTNYFGWQRQNNGTTIQETLENTISKITGESIGIIGCSRTDSGVHAKEYVANFKTMSAIPGDKFKYAINSKLPKDIAILHSEEADLDFHSRYNSKGKTYSYTILNREMPVALYRNYVYHYKHSLDVEAMKEGAKYFIGLHDFEAFKTKGSSVKTSIRDVKELYIYKEQDHIKLYITADGFLYNMVRIIVGTLIDIGLYKNKPEYIKEIIVSKDRNKAGKVVPANGLCLEKVYY